MKCACFGPAKFCSLSRLSELSSRLHFPGCGSLTTNGYTSTPVGVAAVTPTSGATGVAITSAVTGFVQHSREFVDSHDLDLQR